MKPTAIGMLVVLAILVICVACHACRPECRGDGDCRPPLTCRAGKCRPAAALAPEGIKAGRQFAETHQEIEFPFQRRSRL